MCQATPLCHKQTFNLNFNFEIFDKLPVEFPFISELLQHNLGFVKGSVESAFFVAINYSSSAEGVAAYHNAMAINALYSTRTFNAHQMEDAT